MNKKIPRQLLKYLEIIILIIAVAFLILFLIYNLQVNPSNIDSSNMSDIADPKIIMILGSIALGLGVGWISLPKARVLRLSIMIIIALLLLYIAASNDGFVGWGTALVTSFAGFIIAFFYLSKKQHKSSSTFGSSRWATSEDMNDKNLFENGGICIGQAYDGKKIERISYKGDRHLLTVAPTRSGKGTTQIIPNLLSYEGSMLVIDPKGENAMITAQARKEMGQDVFIVDPWGIANVEGMKSAKFNPIDWLQLSDVDITENAMLLADALVVGENHSDSFWTEEAKALLQGFILYVATDKSEEGKRNLGRVRELLLLDSDGMNKHLQKMAKSGHHIVSSTGARSIQKDPKLLSNVLASAQAQTHFLDSTRIRDCISVSDFKFEDLKTTKMTIYLVLPADRLNAFGRWLRLLVQQAITVNARNIAEKPEKPILFILDEFAALGRLSMVEQAYGLMAGFGLQIWGIVQDFNQLERIYDKGWQSFVSNSGMINYFGSSDKMTSEYFSSLCGEATVLNFSAAVTNAVSSAIGSKSTSESSTNTTSASQRKLAYPDELMRMKDNKQLVFIETMPPLIANKTAWFDDEELKSKGVNLQS